MLLATTACNQSPAPSNLMGSNDRQAESANATADVAMESAAPQSAVESRAAGGPNIGPTAAPGVAFNYRYAFRLAPERIAEVQEQHAQMCEQLTVARCRITGLLYRINGRTVEGQLAMKLDPSIARHFGRAGVEAVVRAEGMLTESEITGTDAGSAIRAAGRSIAQMHDDLARIEAQLAQRGLRSDQREELDYRAQQLREQIRAAGTQREAQEESLATTPMVFNYSSNDFAEGFGPPPTLKQSLDHALANFLDSMMVLLRILIVLLPWALAALIVWGLVRFVRRRWFPRTPPAPAAEERT